MNGVHVRDRVDLHGPINHRFCQLHRRLAAHDARIVDEEGNGAKSLLRRLSSFSDCSTLANIEVNYVDIGSKDAIVQEDLSCFVHTLQINVRNRELSAHGTEPLGHESANATTSTRQEYVLFVK